MKASSRSRTITRVARQNAHVKHLRKCDQCFQFFTSAGSVGSQCSTGARLLKEAGGKAGSF